jgi:hypothetical protein
MNKYRFRSLLLLLCPFGLRGMEGSFGAALFNRIVCAPEFKELRRHRPWHMKEDKFQITTPAGHYAYIAQNTVGSFRGI